jgi:hypothetical protein
MATCLISSPQTACIYCCDRQISAHGNGHTHSLALKDVHIFKVNLPTTPGHQTTPKALPGERTSYQSSSIKRASRTAILRASTSNPPDQPETAQECLCSILRAILRSKRDSKTSTGSRVGVPGARIRLSTVSRNSSVYRDHALIRATDQMHPAGESIYLSAISHVVSTMSRFL